MNGATQSQDLEAVFYDGQCPLCQREIGYYKSRSGADKIDWVDVASVCETELPVGLSREQALARFHVLGRDGTLVSGGEAFARLWSSLPAFRWLGRLFTAPGFAWIIEKSYQAFLPLRPRLQKLFKS